jgi:SH3 domain protein
MPRARLLFLVLAWLLLLVAPTLADTRYVSDQLVIALRAAPNADAAVITTLKTDAPVEVLEDNGRFLKVRTDSGEEGYVLSQYVTTTLPKSLQLERLQRERDELQHKLSRLEEQQGASSSELEKARRQQEALNQDLQTKLTATEQELAAARRESSAINDKYQALQKDAQNVVAVGKERDRLQAENAKTSGELARLREENNSLLRSGMIQWFLAGGGVFFLGWLVGKLSRKKRRTF